LPYNLECHERNDPGETNVNSLERVECALRRQQPDRVPITEFVIDEGVARAMLPDIKDVPDFMDRMDMDAISCGASFPKVRDFPDGTFIDEWGVTYRPGAESLAHPVKGPIFTIEDAEAYTPPDPDAEHRLGMLPEVVVRYKGKRAILFHARAAFMWSAYLLGIDNLLASFLAEPELATIVMDKVLDTNMRIVRRAIRAGAEIVVLGDDYAHNLAPLMSPSVFREFVLPRLAKMVATIHEEGAFCVKHTDGNIYPILDMIVSTGIDGLNPIEPVAGMDLATVKRLVGDKVCLLGNIDCGELLSHGTPEQVEKAVIQAIKDGGDGGGYIITSSNSIHSSVNPANYSAMIQAVRRYGTYS
jgi:uroporphyrinogen decarboxylase